MGRLTRRLRLLLRLTVLLLRARLLLHLRPQFALVLEQVREVMRRLPPYSCGRPGRGAALLRPRAPAPAA